MTIERYAESLPPLLGCRMTLFTIGWILLKLILATPLPAETTLPAGWTAPATPLSELVAHFRPQSANPQRLMFEMLVKPRLDLRHVSEFVIGRREIESFIHRHQPYFLEIYRRTRPDGDIDGYAAFLEHFIAPAKVEIGTFFFKERFARHAPFPIVLFDAAFDGDGIQTLGDLQAALESFEIPRLALMSRGIDYGSFRLDRERFLQQQLLSVKLALECIAVDRILCDAAQRCVQISKGFEAELRSNYRRYYHMLERLADGTLYTVDAIGNPFCIDTPLDMELGRAQLARMHFVPEHDPQAGWHLRPVTGNQLP